MGHRVNRHIVLVFVSFLLAGLVLTASAQMASGPIEPGAGTCGRVGFALARGRDAKPWEGLGRATGGDKKVTTQQHVSARNGSDPVLDWNVNMVQAILSVPPHPFGNRAAAITHVAMFTALNSITEQYEPYQGMTGCPTRLLDRGCGHRRCTRRARRHLSRAAEHFGYAVRQLIGGLQYLCLDPGIGVGEDAAAAILAASERWTRAPPNSPTPRRERAILVFGFPPRRHWLLRSFQVGAPGPRCSMRVLTTVRIRRPRSRARSTRMITTRSRPTVRIRAASARLSKRTSHAGGLASLSPCGTPSLDRSPPSEA